jgi:hypothetical protein
METAIKEPITSRVDGKITFTCVLAVASGLLVEAQLLAQSNAPIPSETNLPAKSLPQSDIEISLLKQRQFLAFNPRYKEEKAARATKAQTLGKQVIMREVAGQDTRLSHQILSEIIWLISSTADFKRIDQRLEDLESSLAHPEREAEAEEQNPDGSWGMGYTEWFFKLDALFSKLEKGPQSGFHLLDRINSPAKLTAYFESVATSDIARNGVDHEREFNESLSVLLRLLLRGQPKGYAYDPKLKATLLDLILHRFRNPATGFWGERYVQDGHVRFENNLSMTFHVVSYLNGEVPDMDRVVATTLAIKDSDFPAGWLLGGKYWDHLNMDVSELFRLGWPHASTEQKEAITIELNKMLHWCLTESLQPDGSFKFVQGDNSKEEGTYYGVSFLSRIGFFDKSRRFWTDQEFLEANEVRQRIIAYIEKHRATGGAGGEYYRSALRALSYDQVQAEKSR